ncbi:MAG: lytic transglycosylase domain-containing protein [Halothiobacillaceae bacterium]
MRLLAGQMAALLLLGSTMLSVAHAGLEDERLAFREALAALQADQREAALARLDDLHDYPLKDYLRYLDLSARLEAAPMEEVAAFLRDVPDSFMSEDLRKRMLRLFADTGDWASYLAFDDAALDGFEFRCQRVVARGMTQGWRSQLTQMQALWNEGKAMPESCQRIEDWLAQAGYLTPERLWKRIEQAMEDGRTSEARRLAARVGAQDRIPDWVEARKSPERFLKRQKGAWGDAVLHFMLADAIKGVARKDAAKARALWLGLAAREVMSAAVRHEAEVGIAMAAARQHRPEASDWFEGVPVGALDKEDRAWKVRAALRTQRWDRVLAAIEAMPAKEQAEEEWRYWRARALEALGQDDAAQQIWRDIARGVSYYGLLAADRAGVRYGLAYVDLPPDEMVEQVAARPAIRRAREFHAMGLVSEARKEWQVALRDLDPSSLRAAAHLAARWGWMDRAAITMGKAHKAGLEDLEVRFPLPWRDDVERFARQAAIDSGWMFGVIRRESAFMPDIGSRAGAQGLMQLMPETAEYVAKKFDLPIPGSSDLHDPVFNMRLGSAYLRYVLDKFDENQVLATAAYNAGPERVKQWLPKAETLPADIWVDTVPFTETREYCRAVLHYATVFEWRLYGEARPLSARMPNISGG